MKGTEKAHLFKTGQYGRLYIVSGSHARGRTLMIQVLPKDEVAIPNGSGNCCLNPNAVVVYDVVSGQRGWTEVYGWIHNGKWQEDFEKLVLEKEAEVERELKEHKALLEETTQKREQKTKELLGDY